MLNYLLVPFVGLPHFGFLRLFQWITFRAAGAAVSAILLTWIVGPGIMRRLRRMRLHQVIREGTPDAHQQKGRTPTMGGLIILGATLISTLLWARLDNRYVLIAMISMAWMGAIGFWDDYLKLKQKLAGKKNTGLVESYKLAGQVILEVDDGESVVLNAGDTYVQGGTRHRWRNVGDVPAVLAAVAVGAHHRAID